MKLLAIDPGTLESAFVMVEDTSPPRIIDKGIVRNGAMRDLAGAWEDGELVIEMIQSFGMPVGKSTFETVLWIGRFVESASRNGVDAQLMYRRAVKLHLCNSSRAKDANVRQAVMDCYPASGGGKTPQVGTKNQPGPLYGVSKDVWSALAIAITHIETGRE